MFLQELILLNACTLHLWQVFGALWRSVTRCALFLDVQPRCQRYSKE